MLAISVRNTLKGNFFNKYRYHIVGMLLSLIVPFAIYGAGTDGKELSGICGFKYSLISPYLFFITSLVFIIAAAVSVTLFRKAIPDNSFFRN
jgi:uncharacterized membrane protein